MASYNSITIIISPYHVGEKEHRVGRGPKAFLAAGLIERISEAAPNVKLNVVEIEEVKQVNTEIEGDIGRSFAVLHIVSKAVKKAAEGGSWPLVLSGNCMGVVGVNAGLNAEEPSPGEVEETATREVIWFDAHADLETPDTTESGYLDGMGGSMLLGQGFGYLLNTIPGYRVIRGKFLVAVGFRSMSGFEEEKMVKQGVRLVRGGKPLDIDPLRRYVKDLDLVLMEGEDREAVLHMDVDVLDTSIGKANDFAVEGGLSARDLLECMDLVSNRRRVKAMHVASLNPGCEGWENIVQVAMEAIVLVVQKVTRD